MAELIYTISGDNSGILSATNAAIANIENMTSAVNDANAALQFSNGVAALDKLGTQLLIVQGNVSLFGDTAKLQSQQLAAYQTAINSLLANGFNPLGADVQLVKSKMDDFTASINAQVNASRAAAEQAEATKQSLLDQAEAEERAGALSAAASYRQNNLSGPVNAAPVTSTIVGSAVPSVIQQLNEQLQLGAISAKQYQTALQSLGSSLDLTSGEVINTTGVIEGLKLQLAGLNEARIIAPQEDLANINAQIQQTEIELQQAGNVGKVGFDSLGNAIRGVSITNVNGQLIALNNNLFGGRQIAKDFTRVLSDGGTSISAFARNIGLMAVDFLYYAQNAQFAAAATTTATTEIAVAGETAAVSSGGFAGLGGAFASLLTPINGVILGIALAAGALVYLVKNNKDATQTALDHAKALKQQKEVLNDYISTLSAEAQAEAAAGQASEEQTTKLNVLYDALELQISAGKDYTTQLQDLQNAFPQFFANIDTAVDKTNALKIAYGNASEAVKELGLVTAASQLAGKSNLDVVSNQVGADSLLPKLNAAKQALDQATEEFNKNGGSVTASFSGPGQGGASNDATYLAQLSKNYEDIKAQIDKYNTAVAEAKTKTQQFYAIAAQNQNLVDAGKDTGIVANLKAQLTALQSIHDSLTSNAAIEANNLAQEKLKAQIKALEPETQGAINAAVSAQYSIQKSINDLLLQANNDISKNGLTGYAKTVADINAQYSVLNNTLAQINAKIAEQESKGTISKSVANKDYSQTGALQSSLALDQAKALSDAQIKDAQDTSDAITAINSAFGVKQQAGYNEELASIQKLYDTTIAKAEAKALTLEQINANYKAAQAQNNPNADSNYNAQIQQYQDSQKEIAAAHADLLPAIEAVDAKYIEQEEQTYAKIIDIADQAFETLDDGEESRTDKINLEWQKRITSANTYFNKLRDLAKASITDPQAQQAAINNINSTQTQVNSVLNAADFKAVSEEISKNFADAMQSAVQGFVSNFYTSLTGLGAARQAIDEKYNLEVQAATSQTAIDQINAIRNLEQQTTTSFGAIFSSLVSKFESTFNESILNSFTKQLTENLGKTLITPTAKQLTISPEQQGAQQAGVLLKSAGDSLATSIKQAGIDAYNKTSQGGTDFATIVKQAGVDFYTATKTGGVGSLSTAGSSGIISTPLFPLSPNAATVDPNGINALDTAATSAGATQIGAAATAAGSIIGAGTQSASATKAAASEFSSKVAGAAVALSLAGGLISGATSPTSSAGQGIGGLLQGAGEGAVVGAAFAPEGVVIGAIAGAIIGGISGLLSASKARKALQEQQLAQAEQQTALLQSELAYTTSIIGRDTVNGVVTGISVGSLGQLTATIAGKDLQFILDRNSNGR